MTQSDMLTPCPWYIMWLQIYDYHCIYLLEFGIEHCTILCKLISNREDVYRVVKAVAATGEWVSPEAKRYIQSLVRRFFCIVVSCFCKQQSW